MFNREIKTNLKSFIIWTSVMIVMFLVVFLIYPSIINNENIKLIDEMMTMFPKEVLVAFNMDISSIDSAFGWFKTEGFTFVILITGIYSAIIGSNILLKEESDKTIEYLGCLPITRNSILKNKIVCGLIYIVSMIIFVALFNLIGLAVSGNFDIKNYLLLSITPLFSSLVIFSLCLFISTFMHKTKYMIGISLGIIFFSYFMQVISSISDKVEFLKYISIFTLTDTRNIILTNKINILMPIISILLMILFLIMAKINYNKKELVA